VAAHCDVRSHRLGNLVLAAPWHYRLRPSRLAAVPVFKKRIYRYIIHYNQRVTRGCFRFLRPSQVLRRRRVRFSSTDDPWHVRPLHTTSGRVDGPSGHLASPNCRRHLRAGMCRVRPAYPCISNSTLTLRVGKTPYGAPRSRVSWVTPTRIANRLMPPGGCPAHRRRANYMRHAIQRGVRCLRPVQSSRNGQRSRCRSARAAESKASSVVRMGGTRRWLPSR
jgi:hypothetical protein